MQTVVVANERICGHSIVSNGLFLCSVGGVPVMKIFCCGCQQKVEARLTDGAEIYPHRDDLAALPFWKCDACGNFVGCHHKTKDRVRPLGIIPTPEIRAARKRVHRELDPLWEFGGGKARRRELYAQISQELGYEFHTAGIRSVEEAERVLAIVERSLR